MSLETHCQFCGEYLEHESELRDGICTWCQIHGRGLVK